MKITAIKQQERLKDRYSVFVDGKYSFSLSEGALIDSKLATGQEVDAAQLKELKQTSADDKIYGLALRYAAMRLRSEWELRTYLQRKQASPALADSILNKLSKIGFVDDEAFARAWIDNRRLLRPTSKRKLQQELRVKHVDDGTIQKVLTEDKADELVVLRQLVAKKRSRYPDQAKLMQYLARQGFSYNDIKSVLEEPID